MTRDPAAPQPDTGAHEEPQFSAVLRPHRSLSRPGFLLLMLVLGGISFAAGVGFLMLGAWPVFGFLGLDVALIYLAFRLNYRDGRAYETVQITRQELKVVQVQASGRRQSHVFNPYWAKVRLSESADGRNALMIGSHGQELVIGQFLCNEEREELAVALRSALSGARTAVMP